MRCRGERKVTKTRAQAHDEEQAQISLVHQGHEKGLASAAIAESLNATGSLRRGAPWKKAHIEKILKAVRVDKAPPALAVDRDDALPGDDDNDAATAATDGDGDGDDQASAQARERMELELIELGDPE